MKKLVVLALFLSGFLAHKFVIELINLRSARDYEACIKPLVVDREEFGRGLSPYMQCKHHLELKPLEQILLYQPNIWCRATPSFCD
jgi:hypothetical protein